MRILSGWMARLWKPKRQFLAAAAASRSTTPSHTFLTTSRNQCVRGNVSESAPRSWTEPQPMPQSKLFRQLEGGRYLLCSLCHGNRTWRQLRKTCTKTRTQNRVCTFEWGWWLSWPLKSWSKSPECTQLKDTIGGTADSGQSTSLWLLSIRLGLKILPRFTRKTEVLSDFRKIVQKIVSTLCHRC